MLIVLKKMIKETAVFFLLLVVIAAGFLQSFFSYLPVSKPPPPPHLPPFFPGDLEIGADATSLDASTGNLEVMKRVLHSMTQAFLDAPDFAFYEDLAPPFGLYLFYLYNFIVSVCMSPLPRLGRRDG